MLKIFSFCAFLFPIAYSQVVNNVRVINHREYMVGVISETVRDVERREWCNMKIADFTQEVNELVVNWDMNGTLRYANGFVVSIEHVNVLESSLNQIWSNVGDGTVQVTVSGQLRMINVAMGFDVEADLVDGHHQYTGVITHPLVTFDFSIIRNAHNNAMSVLVAGAQEPTSNVIRMMPVDRISDAISEHFSPASTTDGITGWASQIFQPIAQTIINTNRVPFPGFCYDCPAT